MIQIKRSEMVKLLQKWTDYLDNNGMLRNRQELKRQDAEECIDDWIDEIDLSS